MQRVRLPTAPGIDMTLQGAFHIAVFCKAPVEGRVKTRLIPALGAARATAIYRQLVRRTLDTVRLASQRTGATASLWVADDVEHSEVVQWSHEFRLSLFQQQGDDLGARMLHCLQTCSRQHSRVLLIGTDCPALAADDLIAAATKLNQDSVWVFTPAEDGGYVLVGSRAPTATPFTHIAWSTNAVMAQTRSALSAGRERWVEMPTLWDIDEPADVTRAIASGLLAADKF